VLYLVVDREQERCPCFAISSPQPTNSLDANSVLGQPATQSEEPWLDLRLCDSLDRSHPLALRVDICGASPDGYIHSPLQAPYSAPLLDRVKGKEDKNRLRCRQLWKDGRHLPKAIHRLDISSIACTVPPKQEKHARRFRQQNPGDSSCTPGFSC
jgi:hypothetical protein